jgi:hypothetical protein
MIIKHHEMLVWQDERIRYLTAQVRDEETDADRVEAKEREDRKQRAKGNADLAEKEVSAGFPVLHSQQTVFLWGALEGVFEDILVAWLTNEESTLKNPMLKRIKIQLADFIQMDVTERMPYLVSELKREHRAGHHSSIEVFERILEQIGLGGGMDPQLKRNLIELEQVRNILLHKKGMIDSRFTDVCPWIRAKVGTRLVPDEQHVMKYSDAVLDYYELLINRTKSYFASKASPAKP